MPHDIRCRIDAAGINGALELRIGIDLADIAFLIVSAHENINARKIQTERCCGFHCELFLKRREYTRGCSAACTDI